MNIRDLIDETRLTIVSDPSLSSTREVVYTRMSDGVPTTLNSYVGAGEFNKEERENLSSVQSFGGLYLEERPKVNDTVSYDGELFSVTRHTKLGNLYTVYCEIKRHRGRMK